jgi:hypothetical protein
MKSSNINKEIFIDIFIIENFSNEQWLDLDKILQYEMNNEIINLENNLNFEIGDGLYYGTID